MKQLFIVLLECEVSNCRESPKCCNICIDYFRKELSKFFPKFRILNVERITLEDMGEED